MWSKLQKFWIQLACFFFVCKLIFFLLLRLVISCRTFCSDSFSPVDPNATVFFWEACFQGIPFSFWCVFFSLCFRFRNLENFDTKFLPNFDILRRHVRSKVKSFFESINQNHLRQNYSNLGYTGKTLINRPLTLGVFESYTIPQKLIIPKLSK